MVHLGVGVALVFQHMIAVEVIGVDRGALPHVQLDRGQKRSAANVRDNLGHDLTAALKHTEHHSLVLQMATLALAGALATHQCLVNLDVLTLATKLLFAIHARHVFTNKLRHAPCGFVGHA